VTKKLYFAAAISALAFPFIHPFGPVRQQHSFSALLPGVARENAGDNPRDSARVLQVFERACQNCHSERTQWPLYSYLPLVSWALEKDVAEARQHLDLSHWDARAHRNGGPQRANASISLCVAAPGSPALGNGNPSHLRMDQGPAAGDARSSGIVPGINQVVRESPLIAPAPRDSACDK
jgi:hypothetical protein